MGEWVLLYYSGSAGSVGERVGDIRLRPFDRHSAFRSEYSWWHPPVSGLVALGFSKVGISYPVSYRFGWVALLASFWWISFCVLFVWAALVHAEFPLLAFVG